MKYLKKLFIVLIIALPVSGCSQQQSQQQFIGIDAAKALALDASGAAKESAIFEKADLDTKNGIKYYDIEFLAGDQKYEYDVDALTGVIIESKSKLVDNTEQNLNNTQSNDNSLNQSASSNSITQEQAKEIALNHAGLNIDDVTFVKIGLELDDGVQKYEVEFYSLDFEEYDYEINAQSGEIISYDYDAEHYSNSSSTNSEISAEEAKNIALAQIPGATINDIFEFEVDYDDGRLEYEGKIYYSKMEYEFSIDGYSGAIRSWEAEPNYR